ncbi:uncharacterized protein LOC129256147 [Lytechinus pictus]|uniref:uncharacterized protein LOC129256147 n=1 Tax=Lytechinus pictus TaxID=7653 RepID=UPI00240DF131|nr:uncharacterized protein LOC129256147 [Lytechinus pictus]
MEPLPRTLIIVSVVLIWCSFSMVYSRPLHPKKHTTSPFKHHQHHSSAHKNAIMHPMNPTSLRELAFGSHKAAREILPFPLPSIQKQPNHRHHKPTWGAFKPIAPSQADDQTDEGAFGPVVEVPALQPAIPDDDGFGPWVPHGTTHSDKDLGPDGVFGGPIIPTGTKTIEDSGFGAWGAFKPVHHTPAETEFGGNSRTSGGTSKTIHIIPGQAPLVIEESIGPDGFGTFVSSSDDTADDTSDGWFMSFVPYPQPTHDQEPTESSSSAAFADMWGLFRDRKRGCDKSVEGRACSSNSECQGCNRTFQCSTNHRCQKV